MWKNTSSTNMKKPSIKKSKQRPKFDVTYLEEARKDKDSCIDLRRTKKHMCFRPSELKDFHASVTNHLNTHVRRFSNDFDGILLGYDNIKVINSGGAIIGDLCLIHFDVEGDFYVFKPFVGQKLKAIVNKTSKTHIGCLVYNVFNVAIPKPDDDDEWLGYQAQIGHEIFFQIVDTNLNRRLPYIKGELLEILSEIEDDTSTTQNTVTKFTDEDVEGEQEEAETPKKKKKKKSTDNEESGKKKKRKHSEIASGDEIEVVETKKKKKRRSNNVDEDVSVDRAATSTEEDNKEKKTTVEIATKYKKRRSKTESL